jgi:hypothetical protein
MKALGIVISVFGGMMVLSSLNLVRLGKFDLSTSEGIQEFIGGAAFGVILVALGMWLAKRRQPPSNPHAGNG